MIPHAALATHAKDDMKATEEVALQHSAPLSSPWSPALAPQAGVTVRRCLALIGILLMGYGALVGTPVLLLCGLTTATTSLLLRKLATDVAPVVAVALLLLTAVLLGTAAAAARVQLLGWWLLVPYLGIGVMALRLASRTSTVTWTSAAPYPRWRLIPQLPAALAFAIGLRQVSDDRLTAGWGLFGTDLAQHLLALQDIQASGALSYAESVYPRAFHMLLGLTAAPWHSIGDPVTLLRYDLRLMGAATWLALSLVIWAGVATHLRLCEAQQRSSSSAITGATVLGVALLTLTPFVSLFVYLAAAPGLLAIAVLWLVPLAALTVTPPLRPVVVTLLTAVSVLILAHLWQALIIVPPLAWLAYAAPWVAGAWRQPAVLLAGLRRREVRWVGLACLVSAALTTIPMLALRLEGGLAISSIPGQAPQPPWVVLMLSLIAVAWLSRSWQHPSARTVVGACVGLLGCGAVLLVGANEGFDLTTYYPAKAMWFLLVFAAPVLSVIVGVAAARLVGTIWERLGGLGAAARLTRFTVVATAVAAVFAYGLPIFIMAAGHLVGASVVTEGSGTRYAMAIEHATAHAPAVAVPISVGSSPFFDGSAAYIVSKLMSFQTGQPQNHGDPRQVCDDIANVAGPRPAVVITTLDPDLLGPMMDRLGCADTPVIQIPGAHEVNMFFYDDLGNVVGRPVADDTPGAGQIGSDSAFGN